MNIRDYKLEIKGSNESITFGPRSFGESGRDILIIKSALGAIEDYKVLSGTDTPATNVYDPNGWFDCLEGKKVSNTQAATFDSTLRDYLVKFQLDNQFYILCYYFTKYGIPGALATQNVIVQEGYLGSPLDEYNPEADIADWVASDQNKIYLTGGKSIQVAADDINDYKKYTFLSKQIELIVNMFDSEFGTIGEATLAIMHGWLPRTSLFNTGYYFDPRVFGSQSYAYDIVLLALFQSFIDGNLSQKLQSAKEAGEIERTTRNPTDDVNKYFFEKYKEQVAIAEKVKFATDASNLQMSESAGAYDFLPEQFGAILYKTSARPATYKSMLFNYLEGVSENFPKQDVLAAASKEKYQESLERNFEPDPLIDPDPFVINETKIGYFLKTKFTLENLPPLDEKSDNYESTIQELEDLALSHIMSFYGKPEIFYLDTRDVEYQMAFVGDMQQYFNEPNPGNATLPSPQAGPRPSHNGNKLASIYSKDGKKLNDQIWVLSTSTNHELLKLGNDAEVYRSYERDNQGKLYKEGIIEPLIKFVEYRSPSLRPGDVYRAKFFINKQKLDYITKGYLEKLTAEQEQALQAMPVSRSARIQDLCDSHGALGSSAEDNERRYEEYKALASKNKKEIARILREKTLESYNKQDLNLASNIDLGIFGTIDASNPLSTIGSFLSDLEANTAASISILEDPEVTTPSELSITYPDLLERCNVLSKDVNDSYSNALQEGATFTKSRGSAKNFNGAQKAMLMANLPIEIQQCIKKYGDSNFKFGDNSGMGLGEGNYFDVSPLANFAAVGRDDIRFKFVYYTGQEQDQKTNWQKRAGEGLRIAEIHAGSKKISGSQLKEFPSLIDPIVITWLSNIKEMTGGKNLIESMFTPPPISCRELGIGNKGVGYLTRYTPGLKAETPGMEESILNWYQSEVSEPFHEWKDNLLGSESWSTLIEPAFDTDAFLSVIGKQCTITKLMDEFWNKLSIPGLLCNLLKCLNLPPINIQLPKIKLPPLPPKFNIFGWYVGLIKQMLKKFFEILVRILCSLMQLILDFLKFPCEEQIRDELYGEFAGNAPMIQQALVDGLLDLGIPTNDVATMNAAKEFAAAALSVLTGSEICALLKGEEIPDASLAMLQAIADSKGLDSLANTAAIRNFFETLGILVPDFCDDLESANWIISTTDCEDTTSAAEQYRRKMMAGEATKEDMDKALDLLEKNLKDQLDRFKALGEQGVQGLLPDIVNFGDPSAILNSLPDALNDQANQTMRQLFEPTKMGYLSSLSAFGPGLFLDSPRMPQPGDPEFDPESFITVATITQNLRLYAEMLENQSSDTEEEYISQLNVLHMIYEVDGNNGLAGYEWVGTNDQGSSVTFNPGKNFSDFYDEPKKKNFKALTFEEIPEARSQVIYKPIGFSEDFYYYIDTETGKPTNEPVDSSGSPFLNLQGDDDAKNRLNFTSGETTRVLAKGEGSNLENFSFQMNYVVEKLAEKPIKGLQKDSDGEDEILRGGEPGAGKQVIVTAIKNRINKLQMDLFSNLNRIATPKVGSEYLGGIRRLFSQANETLNENLKNQNRAANELIDFQSQTANFGDGNQSINSLLLNLDEGALRASVKYNEFPNTKSIEFDPYSIEIYNDNMFNRTEEDAITIEVCDTIPGPDSEQQETEAESIYKDAINSLGLDNPSNQNPIYTRRELFARKIMSNLYKVARNYITNTEQEVGGLNTGQILQNINPSISNSDFKKSLTGKMYSSSMEGIFEQIFFALQGSRIYDEENYYPGLARRVAGLMTIEESDDPEEQPCVKNRYNVSQLGLLSFEKMVTDELSKQLSSELSKPENAPENLDFDSEGPFEKAIKNVCFLGFVRICLVELLLKGSLAYSVWDFEGVFDEKIFEEFVFQYVKSELNSKETMRINWENMAARITGIDNSDVALRKLVRNQSMKMLSVSKKIYQNSPSDVTDYHNWYSKYFIPQTHCSKKIAVRKGTITRNLSELGIDDGEVGGDTEFTRTAADKIYWAHPLLDRSNIVSVLEDVERRNEKSPIIDNFASLVGANDPFFHIEHLVEVKGPLASVEGITIPGSAITNSILNVDVSRGSGDTEEAAAVRRVTTVVDNALRTPQKLNLNDARNRTNLPKLDMGSYGFQANPTQLEGSAGAALEQARELNSRGEVDPSVYTDSTEVFNVEDFKATLNFKVSDGNMKKFLRHIQGYMYHPNAENGEEVDPQSVIPDTTHPLLDEYPPEVKKMPTKFIKRTRRVIKFSSDFVSGIFDDLNGDGVESYKRALYGKASPSKYLAGANSMSTKAITDFNKFRTFAFPAKPEETEYFINPANAEELYNIFDILQKLKNPDSESENDNGENQTEQGIYVELSENIFDSKADNMSDEFNQILSGLPEEAKDKLDEMASFKMQGTALRTKVSRSASTNRLAEKMFGFEAGGLIKVDTTNVRNRAGITCAQDSESLFREFTSQGGKLTVKTDNSSVDTTIFENKIGKFQTREDYDRAIELITKLDDDAPAAAAILSDIQAKEEHWVETVYEFSGQSAILAGVYGSWTIGETMDPAVFRFKPTQGPGSFTESWQRVLTKINSRYGLAPISVYVENACVSYGRTFLPKYRYPGEPDYEDMREHFNSRNLTLEQEAEYKENIKVSSREPNIPYLARPMGIDKLTNRRLTSKILTRAVNRDPNDFLYVYSPYGREFSLDPVTKPSQRFISLNRSAYTAAEHIAVHAGTQPLFSESPRPDSAESYTDVCKIIHQKPTIGLSGNRQTINYRRQMLLPPNIYRVPLRVLVTQVYVGGKVEKVYCRVVPPKYIQNLQNRERPGGTNLINDSITENIEYLNSAATKICNEYVDFLDELSEEPEREAANIPNFTQDFNVDFKSDFIHASQPLKPIERRAISSLQLGDRNVYCSIERIYSEAFHIETRQSFWNSTEELDSLFKQNRGMLMTKTVDKKIDSRVLTQFSSDAERVSYLESLNYFHDIPDNQALGTGEIRSHNFHRTIFSLNNILQWFLRSRRYDSLWGMLTPQNSQDVTAKNIGYGGKQKFPLTRVAGKYSGNRYDNESTSRNNPKSEFFEALRSPWQMGFFDFREPGDAHSFYTSGYKFGTEEYSTMNTSPVYPEGALCLDHGWDGTGNTWYEIAPDERNKNTWYGVTADDDNEIVLGSYEDGGVRNLRTSDPAKYLYPLNSDNILGSNRSLLHTMPLMDGFGDYYTNYNRLNGLPMLQSGFSLFCADGRISMDDVSKAIKIATTNAISEASGADATSEYIGASVLGLVESNLQIDASFFRDKEGNISADNYKFIKNYLLSIETTTDGLSDSQVGDIKLNMEGISPQNNIVISTIVDMLSDINTSKLTSKLNKAIESIRNLLEYLIAQNGAQIRYQTLLENVGKNSIFSSNVESLKQLSILYRFLRKIQTVSDGEDGNVQKITLLAFMGGYDFAKTVIEQFGPGSTFSQLQKEAEEKWALCCLMWIHLWWAHRDTEKRYLHTNDTYNRGNLVDTFDGVPDRNRIGPGKGFRRAYFLADASGNLKVYSTALHDEHGRPDIGFMFTKNKSDWTALSRIINLITYTSYSLVPRFIGTNPSNRRGRAHANFKFYNKMSRQGITSHDKRSRFTKRIAGGNDAPAHHRATLQKLKKFLDGGVWNYDPFLRRPLTNREIIDAVYTCMNFSRIPDRKRRQETDWSNFLFADTEPKDPFDKAQYSEIIKNGLAKFAKDENFKEHNKRKWKGKYDISTGGLDEFVIQDDGAQSLKELIKKVYNSYASEGFEYEKDGISNSASGFIQAAETMNNAITSRNAFKTSLYSRGSNQAQNREYALSKANLTLSLGKEVYSAMFPDDDFGKIALSAALTSPKAARGYTYKQLKTIYNQKSVDNYRASTFIMKYRYQQALKNYTAIPQTIGPTMFDGAAIINNQVIGGLFENSKVDQVCRLVMNFNNLDNMGIPSGMLESNLFQLMSEEQRSILMGNTQDMGSNIDLANMTLSVPVAEYREPISKFGMTGDKASENFLVSCYSLDSLVQDFEKKTSWMAQELLAKDSSKLFMKYVFPTKRYQALATIFATTSMSGYTTMPSLMRAPKSSLSFLMGVSSMSSKERIEMFKNMSQAELFKALSDNKSSEPGAMKCFDLPFDEDFLDNFLDLLLEQIKEFPAVLFRGLANVIDPAYKEMKMHWDDCDMRSLTYGGWKPFTARGPSKIQGGAHGPSGDKKYASLLVTSVADIGWSVSRLFVPGQMSKGAKGLKHAVSHIGNYIYKGPISLFDGAFQFQFPCKDVDEGWQPGSYFNSGRYGHPFTPLTYIALAMPELKGDKRLRQMSGRCLDDFDVNGPLRSRLAEFDCQDEQDAPFGEMPEPEDFDESE